MHSLPAPSSAGHPDGLKALLFGNPLVMPIHPDRARALWRLAKLNDDSARAELVCSTLRRYQSALRRIAAHLAKHACLHGRPVISENVLLEHICTGVKDAVDRWDLTGSWNEFSAVFALTRMWERVARKFEPEAKTIVLELAQGPEFPPPARPALIQAVPEIVEAVLSEAPLKWLVILPGLPVWQAWVVSPAAAYLWERVQAEIRDVKRMLPDTVRDVIKGMANRYSAGRHGASYAPLAADLEGAALERVMRAIRFNESKSPHSAPFLVTAAKRAMFEILNPRRSHNYTALWLMVQNAMIAVQERKGRGENGQPATRDDLHDDIARELDPAYAAGKSDKPKFSVSMIRKIIMMFTPDTGESEGRDTNNALPVLEELMERARLTEEEVAVVRLRLADFSHDEIAAKLGVKPLRARRVHHNALKKLSAVAKQLTELELTVLRLKIAEGLPHHAIAAKLGISESETHVLFHTAANQLDTFRELHARLSQSEWRALSLALEMMPHEGIACQMELSVGEVAALLRGGIAKLPQPGKGKKRN